MDNGDRGSQSGRTLNSDINVTPLVDVMLVVLIIFIVVTPLLQKGVSVDLPPARHVVEAGEDQERVVTVVLQRDGSLFLGSRPIAPSELDGALRRRFREDPSRALQVKADRSVAFGEVKRILEAGRTAGFRGAAMVARELPPDDGPLAERGD